MVAIPPLLFGGVDRRISNDEVVFRRGGDPAAHPGAGFDHHRRSLAGDVECTVFLTQPAGGVACPTKNEDLEHFRASRDRGVK